MIILLYILAMSWFSNLITWRIDYKYYIDFKRKYLNAKVFKCSTCFGFWFSIPITAILFQSILYLIFLPLVISFVASLMEKNLNMFND